MIEIQCTNCHRPYPERETPFRCLNCGGVFDFGERLEIDPRKIDESLPGIWRYRHCFGLNADSPIFYLGEGDTPLVWGKYTGREVAYKLEYLNPTGSFKDRGTAILISLLKERGVCSAIEDSSGNAGASFAAYTARAGIKARVYVPDYTSAPKRKQVEAYGAEVIRVPGARTAASEAVLNAAEQGEVYASHAYLPHGILGFATIAFEIISQMGGKPGTVIAPIGQGSLLLGLGRGFNAFFHAGIIDEVPKLIGVQALACAPLWAAQKYGAAGMELVTEGETLAEGVRIRYPVRGDAILRMMASNDGIFIAVDESEILQSQAELARQGFYVEPTSAIVWSALDQVMDDVRDPIVLVLTGTGLKSFG
ncbi:pyridoxal-phosphate dependent enzyme [Chloroflexota bacterium]